MREQQLILYETLLSSSSYQAHNLLQHQPFLKPLLELINHFAHVHNNNNNNEEGLSNQKTRRKSANHSLELHLVLLLNQLSKRLSEKNELIDFFLDVSTSHLKKSDKDNDEFIVFSILVNYLHCEGHVGQLARDALLHCMALAEKSQKVADYVEKHSTFCPVS